MRTAIHCRTHRRLAIAMCGAFAILAIGASFVDADSDSATASAMKGAWQPRDEDRSAFRDITDYNIFRADRGRIAEQVERERNPPEPQQPVATTQVTEPQEPADPDASYRLTGISHDAQGPIAYIEQTDTGELTRLRGPSDFSLGSITVIGYDTLVYVVAGEQRRIAIGQNLTGQSARPSTATGSDTAEPEEADTPEPGSREAILQAMRERRERLTGERQPAAPQPEPNPTPSDTPASESTESSSEQAAPSSTPSAPPAASNP
jgi:hypothetical protein